MKRDRHRIKGLLFAIALLTIALHFMSGPIRSGWSDASSGQPVVAELRALGSVEVDHSRPGAPIVGLSLSSPRVTDATMEMIGKLTELRSLSLDDTRVTDAGIRQIGHLTRLENLDLDGVQITDEGLSLLASLKKLERLILRDTQVTNRGLEHLRNLPNLHELGLFDEAINNESLVSLEGMTGLRELALRGARVTRAGIERFQQAVSKVVIPWRCGTMDRELDRTIEHRRVRRQGFTGRLRLAWRSIVGERRPDDPEGQKVFHELLALARFQRDENLPGRPIVELDLSGLRVTDATMEDLGDFTELRGLALHDTRVTDAGIRRISHLPQLRSLVLDGVRITDEGLAALADLRKLEKLTLCDTWITDRGLERLRGLPNLQILCPSDEAVNNGILVSNGRPEDRRLRRQGFTGRLRLGWRSIIEER